MLHRNASHPSTVTLISLTLLLLTLLLCNGCSIVDPEDRQDLDTQLSGITGANRTRLHLHTINRYWVGMFDDPDRDIIRFVCVNKEGLPVVSFVTESDLTRYLEENLFLGIDRTIRDVITQHLIKRLSEGEKNCTWKELPVLNAKVKEGTDLLSERDVQDLTVQYAMQGVLTAAVLAALAPGAMPGLCAYGVDSYCGDITPLPVELLPVVPDDSDLK